MIQWADACDASRRSRFEASRGVAFREAVRLCLLALRPVAFWRRHDPRVGLTRRLVFWPIALVAPLWVGAAPLISIAQALDDWANQAYHTRMWPARTVPPLDWGRVARHAIGAPIEALPFLAIDVPRLRDMVFAPRHGRYVMIGGTRLGRPIGPPPSAIAAAMLTWIAWTSGVAGALAMHPRGQRERWRAWARASVLSAAPVCAALVIEAVVVWWAALGASLASLAYVAADLRINPGPPDLVAEAVFGNAPLPVAPILVVWSGVFWWCALRAAGVRQAAHRVVIGLVLGGAVASVTLMAML